MSSSMIHDIPKNITFSGKKASNYIIDKIIKLCIKDFKIDVSNNRELLNETLIFKENKCILKILCYYIEIYDIMDNLKFKYDKYLDCNNKILYNFDNFEIDFLGYDNSSKILSRIKSSPNKADIILLIDIINRIHEKFNLNFDELRLSMVFYDDSDDTNFNLFQLEIFENTISDTNSIKILKRYYHARALVGKNNRFKFYINYHKKLFKCLPNISRQSYYMLCFDILQLWGYLELIRTYANGFDIKTLNNLEFVSENKKGKLIYENNINYEKTFSNYDNWADNDMIGTKKYIYYMNWVQWIGAALIKKKVRYKFGKMNKFIDKHAKNVISTIDVFQLGAIIANFIKINNKLRIMDDKYAEIHEPRWLLKGATIKNFKHFEDNYLNNDFKKEYPYIYPNEMKTISILGKIKYKVHYESFITNLYKELQFTRKSYREKYL
jgi:hypothetical protein